MRKFDSATGSCNRHVMLCWHWRPLLTTVLACISKLATDSYFKEQFAKDYWVHEWEFASLIEANCGLSDRVLLGLANCQ